MATQLQTKEPANDQALLAVLRTNVQAALDEPEMSGIFVGVLSDFLKAPSPNVQIEALNGMARIVSHCADPATGIGPEECRSVAQTTAQVVTDFKGQNPELAAPVVAKADQALRAVQAVLAPAATQAPVPVAPISYTLSAVVAPRLSAPKSDFENNANVLLDNTLDSRTRIVAAEALYTHLLEGRTSLTRSGHNLKNLADDPKPVKGSIAKTLAREALEANTENHAAASASYPHDLRLGVEVLAAVVKAEGANSEVGRHVRDMMAQMEGSRLVRSTLEKDDNGQVNPGFEHMATARGIITATLVPPKPVPAEPSQSAPRASLPSP
jgi:hypothetical protein